jgi:hypothetical protein
MNPLMFHLLLLLHLIKHLMLNINDIMVKLHWWRVPLNIMVYRWMSRNTTIMLIGSLLTTSFTTILMCTIESFLQQCSMINMDMWTTYMDRLHHERWLMRRIDRWWHRQLRMIMRHKIGWGYRWEIEWWWKSRIISHYSMGWLRSRIISHGVWWRWYRMMQVM